MAFTVTLKNLGAFAAASNLQLFLYKTSDNSLLNAGGDTGVDASSIGSFAWTVSEDRPAEQMLAKIYEGATAAAANIVIDSVLNVGFTEIGAEAAELDSSITDQLDVIQSGVEASLSRIATILERTPDDTGVITFAWPVTDATITGTVSINNASYTPVEGEIAFLRTDAGKHYYTLTHDAADRPVAAGSARYSLTDGTYTRYMVLRVVESGDTGEAAALAILKLDWETITGEIPSRSVLNALRHIRNKWALDGHTKTVYAEDDTTPAYTTTVTADGAGNITADTPD